jgi:aldose 1-epimerase
VSSPTGDQFVITRTTETSQSHAIITQVAAALRTLVIDGVDITEPYGDDVVSPFAAGIVQVPWSNRVDDGMWVLDGVQQFLDISEPRYHNAIHGLLRFTPYSLEHRTKDSVTLAATIFPQHGYPFHLETSVTYQLVDNGLAVSHTVTNVGTSHAPVAIGTHPYLRIGDVPVDQLVLTVNAATRFQATQRLIPFVEMPVEGSDYDLRHGAKLSSLKLDDSFGQLTMTRGRGSHSLTAPDGRHVELWHDDNFTFVHVFTPRNFPRSGSPGSTGLAVAIEPMTSPPNAFVTKRSLTWLEPSESWTVTWGLNYDGGNGDGA